MKCPECNGKGTVDEEDPFGSHPIWCPRCQGAERIAIESCFHCKAQIEAPHGRKGAYGPRPWVHSSNGNTACRPTFAEPK